MSLGNIKYYQLGGRDHLTDNSYFLAHQNEPEDSKRSFTPDQVRHELREGRHSLKLRMWRNMRKIRRHL
jgi:hypothetical protein